MFSISKFSCSFWFRRPLIAMESLLLSSFKDSISVTASCNSLYFCYLSIVNKNCRKGECFKSKSILLKIMLATWWIDPSALKTPSHLTMTQFLFWKSFWLLQVIAGTTVLWSWECWLPIEVRLSLWRWSLERFCCFQDCSIDHSDRQSDFCTTDSVGWEWSRRFLAPSLSSDGYLAAATWAKRKNQWVTFWILLHMATEGSTKKDNTE
jgi:hypothetical protein